MLSSPKAIALAVLSLLSVASGSPLVARSTCTPNFQGADLVVANRADPTFSIPDSPFNFQFTGQPTNTFVIRPTTLVDQVVAATAATAGSGLDTVPINFNSADPLQLWNVVCQQCGDPSATSPFTSGCTVSLANSNLCVQLDATLADPLTVETCAGGNNQLFDFSTA